MLATERLLWLQMHTWETASGAACKGPCCLQVALAASLQLAARGWLQVCAHLTACSRFYLDAGRPGRAAAQSTQPTIFPLIPTILSLLCPSLTQRDLGEPRQSQAPWRRSLFLTPPCHCCPIIVSQGDLGGPRPRPGGDPEPDSGDEDVSPGQIIRCGSTGGNLLCLGWVGNLARTEQRR